MIRQIAQLYDTVPKEAFPQHIEFSMIEVMAYGDLKPPLDVHSLVTAVSHPDS